MTSYKILNFVQVPPAWTKKAYDSLNGLSAWYADLLLRIKELEGWTSDFNLPSSVWLPGFFNPQSFLTAIMQSTARKNELPLDKMCLVCEVTKKLTREEIPSPPRDGANVHGLYMEVTFFDKEIVHKDITSYIDREQDGILFREL